uniref:Uncharacterized protein n=1 Tax=Cannabis sativa TaxID=3483 RepID=A0A803NR20_CANSA
MIIFLKKPDEATWDRPSSAPEQLLTFCCSLRSISKPPQDPSKRVANSRCQSFNWTSFPGKEVPGFIERCWKCFAVESFEEVDFTVNVSGPVVGETSRVEGYNPKRPDIPPCVGEAPPGETKGREETLVNVTKPPRPSLSPFFFFVFSF